MRLVDGGLNSSEKWRPARKLVVDFLLVGRVRLDLALELLDELDDFLDGASGSDSELKARGQAELCENKIHGEFAKLTKGRPACPEHTACWPP